MDTIPDYGLTEDYATSAEVSAAIAALNLGTASQLNVEELPNKVRQVAVYETSAYVAGTATAMPLDDTIPQKTEGSQFMEFAFTPTASDSVLLIKVEANLDNQSGSYAAVGALFADDAADAIAAGYTLCQFTAGVRFVMQTKLISGSTTARTYKFRAGTPAAVALHLNGYSGRLLGGVCKSSITIIEYAP